MLSLVVLVIAATLLIGLNINFTKQTFEFKPFPSLAIIIMAIVLANISSCFGTVAAGDTGVVTRFGAVEPGNLKREGLYMVVPVIEHVAVMDTKPHQVALNDLEAVTSDRQEVHTSVALIVQVDPNTADSTYRSYRDTVVDQVVMPKFNEAVKTVTAKYDAKTQVQNRGMVQAEMLAYIQHELQGKGVLIGPGALSITNFRYNDDYQKSIEDTAVSQQNLVKAQADLKVNQIEAEQKVAEARGEAESQALLARTINANSLQYEFYKHWDGHLPSVVGSSGNILDVSSMIEKK